MNGLFIIVGRCSEGGGGLTDKILFCFLFPKPIRSESLSNIQERGDSCFLEKIVCFHTQEGKIKVQYEAGSGILGSLTGFYLLIKF